MMDVVVVVVVVVMVVMVAAAAEMVVVVVVVEVTAVSDPPHNFTRILQTCQPSRHYPSLPSTSSCFISSSLPSFLPSLYLSFLTFTSTLPTRRKLEKYTSAQVSHQLEALRLPMVLE
ncbi:hypothetical protein E2C01_057213 [Portunus trituberculatus]|uniref:Secreted protein n=1 Tax=Portunus trituberculatus TaxID=210409 RepID=A0A5B7GZR6_PORTR|nr:hypothetical protein [Portunus trituberculatus]